MASSEGMKLEDLSPAARKAVETKSIEGGWDGRSLSKLLAELERWDDMAEARKSRAAKVFWTGLIGSFIGLFVYIFTGAALEDFLLPLPLLLVMPVVLIVGIRMKKAAQKIDLPNEIRTTLRPLFRLLSEDLHPEEKIRITMNLNGIDEKVHKGKRKLPPGRFKSLDLWTYEEPVFNLRLPLLDGTQVVLRLDNDYQKLQRLYTSRRGKTKSKTKWKKYTTVTAIMHPPARINWEAGRMTSMIDPSMERLTFVEKDGVLAARLDHYYKFSAVGSIPGDAAPAKDVITMLIKVAAMRPQAAGGAQ